MNEPNDFSLVRRSPSEIEKAEPSAKRVLSGIVTDTLVLAKAVEAQLESWCRKGESYDFCGDKEMGPVPEDEVEAEEWARRSHQSHYQRSKEAAKWFRKAAERGHAKAQFFLGELYDNGLGVAEDVDEAIQWYRKAAEQGNADAQTQLGFCYLEGDHVPKNAIEAVKWFRMAALQNDLSGQINLAKCYTGTQDIAVDYCEAYRWFKLAAQDVADVDSFNFAGLRRYAAEALDSLATKMLPDERAEGERRYLEFKTSH